MRESKECLFVVFLVIIRSEPLLDGEGAVFIPAGIVGEDENSEDPRNFMLSES